MVITYETDSETVVATIVNGEVAERYGCAVSTCSDPVCNCLVIILDLTLLDTGDKDQKLTRRVEIELVKKSLGFKDTRKMPREALRFAELFLNNLTNDDFLLLSSYYLEIKRNLTEKAKLDEIDPHFNFRDIEKNGLMLCFNEVLPFADRLYATVADNQYSVSDQYCLQTNCSCTETYLGFIEIDEKTRSGKDVCYVSLDYKKRVLKLIDDSPVKLGLSTLQTAMEQQIPDLYETLRQRHLRLKTIYAFCKKKHFTKTQPLVMPKVARNDPCPCGNGKKYQKCCANNTS